MGVRIECTFTRKLREIMSTRINNVQSIIIKGGGGDRPRTIFIKSR